MLQEWQDQAELWNSGACLFDDVDRFVSV